MHPRSSAFVLRAWETAAAFPRGLRGPALLACLEEPDAMPVDRFARLPIGARDARLLAWRAALFGAEIRALVECPNCSESVELTFTVPDAEALGASASASKDSRIERGGLVVDFRLLDTLDLSSIDGHATSARTQLLERCVVSVRDRDGNTVDARSIPDDVVNELSARVSALDPLVDVQLDATCDRCGNEWEAPFDVVPFVWSEIEGAARSLLVDVHDLAVAYGWSEHEVLSLTPERRQAYLELVRG